MLPINRDPAPAELRRFAHVWLPLFLLGFGGVLWWRLDSVAAALAVWAAGAAVTLVARSSPARARAVFVGLQIVTYPIGLVVSTVILAVLFYGMFTPLGWLLRLTGRDPLRLRARGNASHWLPYRQKDDVAGSFRQY